MGKYKICVYAICKNEEKFVERWVNAVKEADMIIVTDTGSTDGTVQKLREKGVTVYEEKVEPWRFDVARNVAMEHIPEDVDICVSNDLDEIFEPGWREKLEMVWQPYHTRAQYLFTWSYHADGTPNKQFTMEKIHRRKDFRWIRPVHERLEYTGKDKDISADAKAVVLNHYPDLNKSRGQYLPLLEMTAKEFPNDSQIAFWLGREYFYHKQYSTSILYLNKFLNMKEAVWPEERGAAYRIIAKCYKELGNLNECKSSLYKAIAECPMTREAFLDTALFGYEQGDWNLCLFAAENGLKIIERTNSYLLDATAWGYTLDDLAAIAAYNVGQYDLALRHAKKALEYAKKDKRLQNNYNLILKKVEELNNGKV